MANLWFRLYSEFSDDPKVQMLPEAMQRRLVMLMCNRCKGETLHETQRAFHWRISPAELAETKAFFVENGFIDEAWNLLNWNKRQFLSDSSTERVRRYRSTMKQDETLQTPNVTPKTFHVTPPDTDTEQIQNRTEQKKQRTPPAAVELPEWMPPSAWDAYVRYRKKGKAPFTEDAARVTIRDLTKLREAGQDIAAVLEQSIQRGWTGVFEIKTGGVYGNGSAPKPTLARQLASDFPTEGEGLFTVQPGSKAPH